MARVAPLPGGHYCHTDQELKRLDALDYGRIADGPGGKARLTADGLMRQAHGDIS